MVGSLRYHDGNGPKLKRRLKSEFPFFQSLSRLLVNHLLCQMQVKSFSAKFVRFHFKFRNGGVARIFQGGAGVGGHTMSNSGYLPDWHVDIQVVFY